jgi:hypothetical protein
MDLHPRRLLGADPGKRDLVGNHGVPGALDKEQGPLVLGVMACCSGREQGQARE